MRAPGTTHAVALDDHTDVWGSVINEHLRAFHLGRCRGDRCGITASVTLVAPWYGGCSQKQDGRRVAAVLTACRRRGLEVTGTGAMSPSRYPSWMRPCVAPQFASPHQSRRLGPVDHPSAPSPLTLGARGSLDLLGRARQLVSDGRAPVLSIPRPSLTRRASRRTKPVTAARTAHVTADDDASGRAFEEAEQGDMSDRRTRHASEDEPGVGCLAASGACRIKRRSRQGRPVRPLTPQPWTCSCTLPRPACSP